ncbi:hypothetical protein CGX12_03270 [Zobellella denitrificans]|uniref:Uncharacterized protein n=1 Tax=Zobellella denitrificans TaxID=347534 RepID=A0A231N2P8_9GAMM|nr:DUF2291 domain-containing protein [Zobellella denitrificans]ATG73806.1 hypothetical protein AN401_07990 [Zobellella denitrificans]OXS16540.1 hypothetical protein CGX12_03270 [Zobellella denitrificans]
MQTELSQRLASQSRRRLFAGAAVAAVLVSAMALDTKVIVLGSDQDIRQQAFSPDAYGQQEFPRIRHHILENAVDARVLWEDIQLDKAAAGQKYGVSAGAGSVIPVSFSGTVGSGNAGIYYVDVEGMPDGQKIRIQTGPAIHGTDIRDATGTIEFGQFKNQIEYQDVGAALNRAMKDEVLASIDTSSLTGKTVEVTGVFKLINTNNWLVTPVRLEVK